MKRPNIYHQLNKKINHCKKYIRIHVCDCNHIYVRRSIFINFDIELININTIMTLKYKIGKKNPDYWLFLFIISQVFRSTMKKEP